MGVNKRSCWPQLNFDVTPNDPNTWTSLVSILLTLGGQFLISDHTEFPSMSNPHRIRALFNTHCSYTLPPAPLGESYRHFERRTHSCSCPQPFITPLKSRSTGDNKKFVPLLFQVGTEPNETTCSSPVCRGERVGVRVFARVSNWKREGRRLLVTFKYIPGNIYWLCGKEGVGEGGGMGGGMSHEAWN